MTSEHFRSSRPIRMIFQKLFIYFTIINYAWRCVDGSNKAHIVSGINTIFEEIGFSSSCVSQVLAICEENVTQQTPLKELKHQLNVIQLSIEKINEAKIYPRNCWDILLLGDKKSGVRTIYPFDCCEKRKVAVFCDQSTDGGGWTVIQRRDLLPEREDFFRKWIEYKLGFGQLTGEFWLGLETIHTLVRNTLMELRIDLEDFEGAKRWAKYEYFYIDASNNYRLDVGNYSGDAGDGFKDRHVGFPFTTKDRDNDSYKENCAKLYRGGWWYDKCHISNLNGFQYQGKQSSYADGINWQPWHGYNYSLKKTSLALRPKSFTKNN